jgi:hypothetical protein
VLVAFGLITVSLVLCTAIIFAYRHACARNWARARHPSAYILE